MCSLSVTQCWHSLRENMGFTYKSSLFSVRMKKRRKFDEIVALRDCHKISPTVPSRQFSWERGFKFLQWFEQDHRRGTHSNLPHHVNMYVVFLIVSSLLSWNSNMRIWINEVHKVSLKILALVKLAVTMRWQC